jgi:hypothetical protein
MATHNKLVKSWRQLAAELAQEDHPEKRAKLTDELLAHWKTKNASPIPAFSLLRTHQKSSDAPEISTGPSEGIANSKRLQP